MDCSLSFRVGQLVNIYAFTDQSIDFKFENIIVRSYRLDTVQHIVYDQLA